MKNELHCIIRNPKVSIKNPPLLILLHGYGSNELDLFSFADELPNEFLIISFRAPYNIGAKSYAWYSINFDVNNKKKSNLDQAQKSINFIAFHIDNLKMKYNTSATFLLGFSQGAILSYALSFQYPNKIKNVIALSGYINEDLTPKNVSEKNIKTQYYVSHGTLDQVLPIDLAKKSISFLNALKLKNVYFQYDIGHSLCAENFFSLQKWLENKLKTNN